MAAGGSGSIQEGGLKRRLIVASEKDLAATVPLTPSEVATIDSLEDLCGWLGTFRERLRAAAMNEREEFELTVNKLEARYKQRRAELS